MTDEDFVKLINESGLSEAELAGAISVSRPTIRRWKAGKNLPHNLVRLSIQRYLG